MRATMVAMQRRSNIGKQLNLDTHILLYALADDSTRRERALLSNETWRISAIVLWEIAELSELGRIEIDLEYPELARALARLHTWPFEQIFGL